MRTTRCGLLLTMIVAACGGDATGPASVAGLYRLVSVNGQPVPWTAPPSLGFSGYVIEHGDLQLRANGSYGFGMGGSGGWLEEGQFRVSGTTVRLLPPPGASPDTTTVTLAGDSAVIQLGEAEPPGDRPGLPAPLPNTRLAFKRTTVPNPVAPGPFALVAVNGRSSLVELDTIMFGERFVTRVRYDTITFIDRIFVRRHRRQESVHYLSNGDSVKGDFEYTTFGAHDVATGIVIVRKYNRMQDEPRRDTLWTVGSDLVRRRQLIFGLREDQYSRR
jgi:hypothetical protein